MNIWNYFSENVTALRMRDNCWSGIQGEMAGDARAAAEQQLVAFEGRGAVEVEVAGTNNFRITKEFTYFFGKSLVFSTFIP